MASGIETSSTITRKESSMSVRIGVNPIGWSNDDDQSLGGATPLETCLMEAAAIGFEGIELGHKFPREGMALLAALKPHGLSCIGGWHSIELLKRSVEDEIAAMKNHVALLKAVSTKVHIVAETSNAIHSNASMPLGGRPVMASSDWKSYGEKMTRLAQWGREQGLQLSYHHHMGTIVQSRDDIARFMDATGDAVHLLLDTGHATWGGSDPVELADSYRTRISHIHCKDVRIGVAQESEKKNWSFLTSVINGVYTQPGDGVVDYVSVLSRFKDYSGWIVVEAEQDPARAHPKTYHAAGLNNLVRFARQAGMTLKRDVRQ
jgi:inosose dehydratase